MKLVVNTETLQSMINKVQKGASNNKLLPLTGFVHISLHEGKLQLDTTDMTNYVSVRATGISGEDFEVVVSLENFAKIVGKTTTENITLELTDSSLKFIGNGTYSIDLPVNEDGELIKFPMYQITPTNEAETISYSDIRSIISANKSCIAKDSSVPVLTYYYCGNEVISANQTNICLNKITLFSEPILISSVMMDLLSLFGDTEITVSRSDTDIMFSSTNLTVYGSLFTEINDYPVEPIEAYLTVPFAYNCKFNKDTLLAAMDRLVIFTDKLDEGTLTFEFSNKALTIYNKNNTSFESVPYLNEVNIDGYTCSISYELIKNQLISNSTDTVDMYFGDDNDACIKIEDGDIVKITSLQE
jgi:DNA polymerase III sliding clamp (beta) subunit (PCNA family)